MVNKKPKYTYTARGSVAIGFGVTLFGVTDHQLVGNLVWTSPVVKFTKSTGRIETQNSIYIPKKEPA